MVIGCGLQLWGCSHFKMPLFCSSSIIFPGSISILDPVILFTLRSSYTLLSSPLFSLLFSSLFLFLDLSPSIVVLLYSSSTRFAPLKISGRNDELFSIIGDNLLLCTVPSSSIMDEASVGHSAWISYFILFMWWSWRFSSTIFLAVISWLRTKFPCHLCQNCQKTNLDGFLPSRSEG